MSEADSFSGFLASGRACFLGRSAPRLVQTIAFEDECADLIPVVHGGSIHPHAVLLSRVWFETRVGCNAPAGMLRLKLEDETAHAILLPAARENPLPDAEALFAEVFRFHGIWKQKAHLAHQSKCRLRRRHQIYP